MKRSQRTILTSSLLALTLFSANASAGLPELLEQQNRAVSQQVIKWRRDIHQHPELSNREFRTAEKVTAHLQQLGLEVTTGIAHTGVVGILRGGKPGPLVALRADMDALPVTETLDLPFASKQRAVYRGQEVGVMHACGHDAHVAILMGVAQSLAAIRQQLSGDVMFVFQPAEEGAPEGEEGGAQLMLKEGLFKSRQPDAVFGLHVTSSLNTGEIKLRSGPLMASEDSFNITVRGRQTHGSRPWNGVDPIVAASQVVMATQTIASRQVDVTKAPSVISFGAINGGIRSNIIPDEVELIGTIRSFDQQMRRDIKKRLQFTAETVAKAAGAKAQVTIHHGYPVTINHPALTRQAMPVLERVAGKERVKESALITGAEDFSYYALEVPGVFFFLGVTPPSVDATTAASNHSPQFYIDEAALDTGVSALGQLTLDYLQRHQSSGAPQNDQ